MRVLALLLLVASSCIAPVYSSYGPYVETTSAVASTSGTGATSSTGGTLGSTTGGASTGASITSGTSTGAASSTGTSSTSGTGSTGCRVDPDAGYLGAPTIFNVEGQTGVTALAAADFNRDGALDVAAVTSETVTVLLNAGADGGFALASAWSWTAPSSPELTSVAAADLNGDGLPDLIFTDYANDLVYVTLAAVDGGFGAPRGFRTDDGIPFGDGGTIGARAVAVADLNGDGRPDLAIADEGKILVHYGTAVTILLSDGDGGFLPPVFLQVPYDVLGGPHDIHAGDLNGDGRPDLLIGSGYQLYLATSQVDGGLAFSPSLDAGGVQSAALGDLDRNGTLDVFAGGDDSGRVFVAAFLNEDGRADAFTPEGLAAGSSLPAVTGSNEPFVALGDIDGDGYLDAVCADNGGSWLAVLINQTPIGARGSFAFGGVYLTPGAPVAHLVGDFNGDGRPDVAVAYTDLREVAVYPNSCR